MKVRVVKCFIAVVVVALCLTARPAWAWFEWERFTAFLNGVNQQGNPSPLASVTETTFVALENTCNGSLIGTAQARVNNQSGMLQVYVNNPNFGEILCVNVTSNLYVVYPWGTATLVATGFENCYELEP